MEREVRCVIYIIIAAQDVSGLYLLQYNDVVCDEEDKNQEKFKYLGFM